MSEGLWSLLGIFVGAVITRWSDWCKEKERQKTIIAVIDAKLDFYKKTLFRAISEDTYKKILKKEEIFKNLTDENLTDRQKELRESPIGKKTTETLDGKRQCIKITLEAIFKQGFLATDHDSAFLGKDFLIDKLKLTTSIMNIKSSSDYLDNRGSMDNSVLWSVFEGAYLLEQLSAFINGKISK